MQILLAIKQYKMIKESNEQQTPSDMLIEIKEVENKYLNNASREL